MRIALVTPIEPGQRGNGSAQRAAFWQRTLDEMGDLTTIVVPLLGHAPSDPDRADRLTVAPMGLEHPDHPWLARQAPQYLGARLSTEVDPFDLVVGFKSYLGPFCLGLVSLGTTPLVIDLDDDDAAFAESIGEIEQGRRFRALVAECRPRANLMVSAQGFAGTAAVPNTFPIETALPDPGSGDGSEQPPSQTVLMVGNATYGPNLDGARWLAEHVWPLVTARVPDAQLVIAGLGTDDEAHGIGFVDDLTELYRTAALTVAPIHSGSGTRIKILESWAQRVPVVATPLGIEGLGAVHGEHALIAADPAGFAEQIIRLLGDVELGRRLVDTADDHVRTRFDPDAVSLRVRQLLQQVCTPPVGPQRIDGPIPTEVDDGLVVDDEINGAIHHLDPIASIVYSLCDGDMTTSAISATLAELLGATDSTLVDRRVTIALDQLVEARLVADDPEFESVRPPDATRRFRVRPATYDANVVHNVYAGNEYPDTDAPGSGTVVIDIGAHIGSFTARVVDAGVAHVIALEPQPDNHRLALINLAGDIEAGTVDLRQLAIWSSPADQELVIGAAPPSATVAGTVNTGGHVARSATASSAGEHETLARSTTVDSLISEVRQMHGPDAPIWFKLDCEGAEWPALESAERLADVDVIYAELHPTGDADGRVVALGDRLVALGFHVELTPDRRGPNVRLNAVRPAVLAPRAPQQRT